MSRLGDMERNDPAYPGSPDDPSTAWSREQSAELADRLADTPPLQMVHHWDGFLWTCLGCYESHTDPCQCPCCPPR